MEGAPAQCLHEQRPPHQPGTRSPRHPFAASISPRPSHQRRAGRHPASPASRPKQLSQNLRPRLGMRLGQVLGLKLDLSPSQSLSLRSRPSLSLSPGLSLSLRSRLSLSLSLGLSLSPGLSLSLGLSLSPGQSLSRSQSLSPMLGMRVSRAAVTAAAPAPHQRPSFPLPAACRRPWSGPPAPGSAFSSRARHRRTGGTSFPRRA